MLGLGCFRTKDLQIINPKPYLYTKLTLVRCVQWYRVVTNRPIRLYIF